MGAFLINAAVAPLWVGVLPPDLFYRDAHRRLIKGMRRLVEAGVTVDLVTLCDDLQKVGDLDAVGGPAYIAALTDGVPQSTHVGAYIGILDDLRRRRALIAFGASVMTRAQEIGESTAHEVLMACDQDLFRLQTDRAQSGDLPDQGMAATEFYTSLAERVAHKDRLLGHSTGLTDLDDLTSGLVAGDLTIIAGATSAGKTVLAMNLARAVARLRLGTVLFESLEMSRLELQYRLAAAESGVGMFRMRKGYVGEDEQLRIGAAMGTTGDWPLLIEDRGRLTVADLRARCRRLAASASGLALVIVDYLQLMTGEHRENRTQEVSSVSRGLKQLGRELHVPIVALSQLNRDATKTKRSPQLSDLRESGSLEQDADNVWMLWEPGERQGIVELLIAKQRQGPLSSVELAFQKECCRFVNAAR